jgi:hypothetical protein
MERIPDRLMLYICFALVAASISGPQVPPETVPAQGAMSMLIIIVLARKALRAAPEQMQRVWFGSRLEKQMRDAALHRTTFMA